MFLSGSDEGREADTYSWSRKFTYTLGKYI